MIEYSYSIPWQMNMEPENHLFEKENNLPNPDSYTVFYNSMLIFRGVPIIDHLILHNLGPLEMLAQKIENL